MVGVVPSRHTRFRRKHVQLLCAFYPEPVRGKWCTGTLYAIVLSPGRDGADGIKG